MALASKRPPPSRRRVLFALGAGMALAVPAGAALVGGVAASPDGFAAAPARSGALPEMSLGRADAPAVVEYLSMTCGHCAGFQERYFPEIRRLAVDTGRVRWAFREFPLDPLAAAASALVRGVEPARQVEAMEVLLRGQGRWMGADERLPVFVDLLAPFGIDDAAARTALADEAVVAAVMASKETGKALGVSATPTFLANGRTHKGGADVEGFMRFLEEAGV